MRTVPACLCLPACLHTRGGGVEAGKQSYNMQEADECCLPIYLPLDASLPHCSLMLSSARAFFAHWKYEQRCKIFQNCAHTLFSTLKLQSASLDLHPCLQFRCLLAGLALWGGRRKGKPRSSRQLAGEWHNLPPLRWSQPGGKGAPRPMKPNVEWTNASSSRSASAPRYLALSLSLPLSSKGQRWSSWRDANCTISRIWADSRDK